VAGQWIFGYGSLVWRPAFPHRRRRPASIRGFCRRFWQASTDHRGTPEAPGRVVTLIESPGDRCWGMAYEVDGGELDLRLDQALAEFGVRDPHVAELARLVAVAPGDGDAAR
jgi:cation transport regulator ChaC